VGLELLNSWSFITVIAEELKDQVLEVLRKASAVDFLEVSVMFAFKEQVVEVLFFASLLDGKMPWTMMKRMTPIENIST